MLELVVVEVRINFLKFYFYFTTDALSQNDHCSVGVKHSNEVIDKLESRTETSETSKAIEILFPPSPSIIKGIGLKQVIT